MGKESSLEDGATFAERFLDAVRQCLGLDDEDNSVPDGLEYVVMLLLTQSGFALAHNACRGQKLALCGGERKLTYKLTSHGERKWQLSGQYIAHGFSGMRRPHQRGQIPSPPQT